jgi:hypothetical protein
MRDKGGKRGPITNALALQLGSLLPAAVATAATVGSVFVSYAVDGSPRYASQRLDASYRLFIRGETVRKKKQHGATEKRATSARNRVGGS